MAGIDLDAQFFKDVSDIAGIVGDPDKVLARAVRFIQLAQERYADGKIITITEFKARGFLPEFIGIMAEMIDDNSVMATRAEEQFGWLRKRRDAAVKGGIASGKVRAAHDGIEPVAKTIARNKLNQAVKAGHVVRGNCSSCGTDKDVEGHHHDYGQPLDVEWLCRPCHKKVHLADFNKLGGSNIQPTAIPSSSSFPASQKKKFINSSSKNLSYEECAQLVLTGTRKFGSDSWEELSAFWGPEICAMVRAAGGAGKFRVLKNDQWLSTNATKMLAATRLPAPTKEST